MKGAVLFCFPILRELRRRYRFQHLHFITCSCYRRLPLLTSARAQSIATAVTGGTIISCITNDWKFSNGILRDTKAFVLETQ
jgi:hypothetical protein